MMRIVTGKQRTQHDIVVQPRQLIDIANNGLNLLEASVDFGIETVLVGIAGEGDIRTLHVGGIERGCESNAKIENQQTGKITQ